MNNVIKVLLKAFRQDLELPCTLPYVNREGNTVCISKGLPNEGEGESCIQISYS